MARASVKTWLPLDRWATIIGIWPLHFNGFDSNTIRPGNVCGEVFFEHAWGHSDRVGREEIAMAIQSAEQEIAAEAGFNLLPDWTVEERLGYPQPFVPGVYSTNGLNPKGMLNSVELPRGHVISGGVRQKTIIQYAAAIVRSDVDADGYNELCTVTVPTTVTVADEIHIYYAGQNADDTWEIRPIKVTLSGGNAIITFKAWQVPDFTSYDDLNPEVLDADVAASYETTVDVFRVYNDPSTQVQFLWENNENIDCCNSCTACQLGTQAGCFHLRDARLGIAVPAPATWSAADSEFDEDEWTACRAPDQIRFWYYSGFRNMNLSMPYVTMDPYWEYAVAYYAASKLDRPVCGCTNVQQFIDKWRLDILANTEKVSFTTTPEMVSNRLGTSMGAIYAWKAIHRNGMRVHK